jgi:hypothetical protein
MMGCYEHSAEHLGFKRVRDLFSSTCELLKEDYGSRVVPSLKLLDAAFSPWRPEFSCEVVHVGFVVDEGALRQVYHGVSNIDRVVSWLDEDCLMF